MSQPTPRRNAEELQRLEALSVLDAGVESDMTLPHIPESEKRQKEPEIAVSNDKIRSAFVIKKGAYEKLVCEDCAHDRLDVEEMPMMVMAVFRQKPNHTPVTLSCEAHCSICDEAI